MAEPDYGKKKLNRPRLTRQERITRAKRAREREEQRKQVFGGVTLN